MQLRSVEIRDYRSIFVDDGGHPLRLDLAAGANTLVGRNNCGKSNVLRAIALALDPRQPYAAEQDAPGPRPFAHPMITLTFTVHPGSGPDQAVLDAAGAYEQSVGVGPLLTRALAGEVVLQVAFVPGPDGVRRHETLLTGAEARGANLDEQQQLLAEALRRLREAVRFVLISSGESLESVLEGNFREILHSVVRERLRTEFQAAEGSRQDYITGLQDSLLRPLRDRLAADVGGMFPEIGAILLAPEVSSIERTLSNVEVSLADIVSTPLSAKGTGVRGGVLVAMLSYLALNATRSMVFAVEEPEAFLHPAAQEDVRDHLEQLAAANGVTLLVTTHSLFTVTRAATGRVFCIAKDRDGRTRVAETAPGDADHAPLIGDLVRAASLESVLTAVTALPAGTQAVVLVEGDGDRFCFQLAAELVGRPDLVAGLHLRPTGGTVEMIAEAVIVRAAAGVPVVIVVDNDEPGRKARDALTGRTFDFTKKQCLRYDEVFEGGKWPQYPVEAEDLFDPNLIQRFVDHHGPAVWTACRKRPDDALHYDLSQAAKGELQAWLRAEARPADVQLWVEMLLLVRARAGLPATAETAAEIVAAAPDGPRAGAAAALDGLALIVAGQHDHARYLETGTLLLKAGASIPDGVTHIGFYAGAIQPHLPAIVADHPNLLFDPATATLLRATGKPSDARVAQVVEQALTADEAPVAGTHCVLLLSPVDDPATVVLDEPVRNTKQIAGRPVAWTVSPKLVPLRAFAVSPLTTDALDAAAAALTDQAGATA